MRPTSSGTEREEIVETGFLVLLRLEDTDSAAAAASGSARGALESEHQQAIQRGLLDAAADVLGPALRIEGIEQSSLFATARVGVLANPAVLLDLVEEAYGAFRAEQRRLEASTACGCPACSSVAAVHLSVIIHHGHWTRVTGIGQAHCHGTDVALTHLVSPDCTPETHGCMLLSDAALDRMGVDAASAGMTARANGRAEPLATRCVELELEPAWEGSDRPESGSDPDDVTLSLDVVIPVSTLDAWDWMTAPDKRTLWEDVDTITTYPRPDRRPGEGTRYHSQQGRYVDEVYEVIEWQPFRRWTWDRHRHGMTVRSSVVLFPAEGGTRVISHFGPMPGAGAVERMIARREIKRRIAGRRSAALERLRRLLEVERTVEKAGPSLDVRDAGAS
jgi:hypothetical protein